MWLIRFTVATCLVVIDMNFFKFHTFIVEFEFNLCGQLLVSLEDGFCPEKTAGEL